MSKSLEIVQFYLFYLYLVLSHSILDLFKSMFCMF